MKRENRYLVVKWEDIKKYLDLTRQADLHNMLVDIRAGRDQELKGVTNYVVVADDWPMYEQTWKAIEQWVDTGTFSPSPPGSGVLPNMDGLLPCTSGALEKLYKSGIEQMIVAADRSLDMAHERYHKDYQEIRAKLNTRNTGGGWISVSDRLPEPHQDVWCLNRDGWQFQGRVCYGMHKPFFTYPRGDGNASNTAPKWIDVTHWMPLLQPPPGA